jgi:hypothetical protein
MIKLSLTKEERLQFQYILPVQGSLKVLELVNTIFEKINEVEIEEKIADINFEESEIDFICEMIGILDKQGKLHFQSLSLIKKILSKEG